jgi:hypothetical protein
MATIAMMDDDADRKEDDDSEDIILNSIRSREFIYK